MPSNAVIYTTKSIWEIHMMSHLTTIQIKMKTLLKNTVETQYAYILICSQKLTAPPNNAKTEN